MVYQRIRCGIPLLVAMACFAVVAISAAKKKIYYADFERTEVTYWNPKYLANVSFVARRYTRRDPIHYVNIHFTSLYECYNNTIVSWYLHEYLSNEYRPSFVGARYELCDFLFNNFLGQFIRNSLPSNLRKCPLPKGMYRLENISISNLPLLATFPFQKGRLYFNWTVSEPKGNNETVTYGHVDAVIKYRFQ